MPDLPLPAAALERLEQFAAENGIPALLDHLGLDGLGNEVDRLIQVAEKCVRLYELARRASGIAAAPGYDELAIKEALWALVDEALAAATPRSGGEGE